MWQEQLQHPVELADFHAGLDDMPLAEVLGVAIGAAKNSSASAPALVRQAPGDGSVGRAAAEARLREVYAEHLPARLGTVDGLLEKWAGREAEIARVEAKYLGGGRLSTPRAARTAMANASVVVDSWLLVGGQLAGAPRTHKPARRPSMRSDLDLT